MFPERQRRRPGLPGRRPRRHVDDAHLRPRRAGVRDQSATGSAPSSGVGRRGARRLELFDLRSGRRTELIPGGEANVADARFGDHRRPAVRAHRRRAGAARAAGRQAQRRRRGVAAPDRRAAATTHDLDLVALDPAGARAALVWNVDGRSEIELLDLRSGHRRAAPRPPGDVVTGRRSPATATALLIGNEGPTVPPTSCRTSRLDRARRAARRCWPAEPPRRRALVTPTLHTFRGEDGLAAVRLAVPAATRAFGAGAHAASGCTAARRPRSARSSSRCSRRCSPQGWRCSRPNVRGSGGYGRSFAAADDLDRRFVAITDVRAAVTFLVESGAGRPGPVGRGGPLVRRLPHAGRAGPVPGAVRASASTCAGSPTSPRSTPRPSRGSRRRPSRSTATRRPTPTLLRALSPIHERRPDHRAAAGRARRVRHERADRRGRADRGGAARPRGVAGVPAVRRRGPRGARHREPGAVRARGGARGSPGHLLDVGEQTA